MPRFLKNGNRGRFCEMAPLKGQCHQLKGNLPISRRGQCPHWPERFGFCIVRYDGIGRNWRILLHEALTSVGLRADVGIGPYGEILKLTPLPERGAVSVAD